MRHTKVKIIPIWRVSLSDKLYYFVVGSNQKNALKTMKKIVDDLPGKPFKVEQISPDDYDKILLQTDVEDEESLTTLAEEAKYFVEHGLEQQFFIASSFDVVVDFSLN
jgi:hypothetical protein